MDMDKDKDMKPIINIKTDKEKTLSVSEFLRNEYKDYSFYVLENRAIPSMVDGLKPIQRKVLYVADKHIRKSFNKVATLAGKVISDAMYHHGNVSCEGAIINMSQDFKNNLSLFERDGQFGSLKSPIASASRYISVKLSDTYDKIYKDSDLLRYKIEEGTKIEPEYYLPIIPMVLINGGSGIAVGFATNILNRDVKDVIKKCITYLDNKKVTKLKLHINEFSGTFTEDLEKSNKWYMSGTLEIKSSSTVKVTELPPSMTYEKFEEHLDKLSNDRLIMSWENYGKGTIDYVIKFTREDLAKHNEQSLMKLLSLVDQVSENFTVLDQFGKLKVYDTAEAILKDFVDFRLSYYDKRKEFLLNKIREDIIKLDNRSLFIKGILDEKIIINKKKKEEIIKQIDKLKIEKYNDSYDYLLSMPIYSLTKEKYDEMLQTIKEKKEEEKAIKKLVPREVYLEELKDLMGKV